MQIKKRIYIVLTALFLVVLAGSTGYYLLFGGKPKFMDCVYMTVISLSSVGYGEVLEVSGNIKLSGSLKHDTSLVVNNNTGFVIDIDSDEILKIFLTYTLSIVVSLKVYNKLSNKEKR